MPCQWSCYHHGDKPWIKAGSQLPRPSLQDPHGNAASLWNSGKFRVLLKLSGHNFRSGQYSHTKPQLTIKINSKFCGRFSLIPCVHFLTMLKTDQRGQLRNQFWLTVPLLDLVNFHQWRFFLFVSFSSVFSHIIAGVKTCKMEADRLRLLGQTVPESFTFVVDPDGTAGPVLPFQVLCAEDSSGNMTTVVSHDRESNTSVTGFESPGSFSAPLTYTGANISQVIALVDASQSCKQYIAYYCHNAAIHWNTSATTVTWWVDRDGRKMLHWGGGVPGQQACACDRTKSCRGHRCNCDVNDNMWGVDAGYLTTKSYLPMTEVRVGDTGSSNEMSSFRVGPLICYG